MLFARLLCVFLSLPMQTIDSVVTTVRGKPRHVPLDVRVRGEPIEMKAVDALTREQARALFANAPDAVIPLLDARGDISLAALHRLATHIEPFEAGMRPPAEWHLARGLSSVPMAWSRARNDPTHAFWRVITTAWAQRALDTTETVLFRPTARPLDAYASLLSPTDHFTVDADGRVSTLIRPANGGGADLSLVIRLSPDARRIVWLRVVGATTLATALSRRPFIVRAVAPDDGIPPLSGAWRCEFAALPVFSPPEAGDVRVVPTFIADEEESAFEFWVRPTRRGYALDVSPALLAVLADHASAPSAVRLYAMLTDEVGSALPRTHDELITRCRTMVNATTWAVEWPRGVTFDDARRRSLYSLERTDPRDGHEMVVSLVMAFDPTTRTYTLVCPPPGALTTDIRSASAVICSPPGGPPPVAVFLYESDQMRRGQAPLLYEGGACSSAPDARVAPVRGGDPVVIVDENDDHLPPRGIDAMTFTYRGDDLTHPTPPTLLDRRAWRQPPNHPRLAALTTRRAAAAWVGIYLEGVHPSRAPTEAAICVMDPQQQLVAANVTTIRVVVYCDIVGGRRDAFPWQCVFSATTMHPVPDDTVSYAHGY